MKDFDGKVALVTGTTGIGRATARRLAEGGAAVVALGIEVGANAQLQAELARLGAASLVLTTDVSVSDQVERAIAAGVEKFGGLDVSSIRRPSILTARRPAPISRPGIAQCPSMSAPSISPRISAFPK